MSQSCRVFLAIICCILFSQLLVLTEANSGRMRSTTTCLSLHVAHGPEEPHPCSTVNVTVSLIQANTGERSFCYKRGTHYSINMKTNGTSVKGLLMVQDEDKVYGKFANPSDFNQGHNLRYGFCRSFGMRSITHNCDSKCNFGTSLNFPYTSPRKWNHVLEFRYSVVFSYGNYHEDVKVLFPPCSAEPIPIPPSKPSICSATEFKVDKNTKRASHNCPNNPKPSIQSVIIKEDNIKYKCVNAGKEIKRKVCGSGCLENGTGEPLCCRVHKVNVTRGWKCTAMYEGIPERKMVIYRVFPVIRHRKCECFLCSDVCPAEKPTSNSNSIEVKGEGEISSGMDAVWTSS